MPKKMFPDVAADFPSTESLSFAGLVCKQDMVKETTRVQKEDLEFDFSISIAGSTNGSSYNNSSAGELISNAHLVTTTRVSQQIPLEHFLQFPGNRRGSDMKQKNHERAGGKQFSQVKRRTYESVLLGGRASAKTCSHHLPPLVAIVVPVNQPQE